MFLHTIYERIQMNRIVNMRAQVATFAGCPIPSQIGSRQAPKKTILKPCINYFRSEIRTIYPSAFNKPKVIKELIWLHKEYDWLIDWLIDGLIDWLIDWLIDRLTDWLIDWCFTSRSRIVHLYGDDTITGEGLQNLGLWSALRAFEQGGIFIVPQLLWHGSLFFPVSSKIPIQSPPTTHKGMWRIYCNPDHHGSICNMSCFQLTKFVITSSLFVRVIIIIELLTDWEFHNS
jgi:hypothetical protein